VGRLAFGVVEIDPGTINRQQKNGRKQPKHKSVYRGYRPAGHITCA
jgi:hypothetical protein